MDYQTIKAILEKQDYNEVVKAIFSFETGIENEHMLNHLLALYFEKMDNFLDEELQLEAMKYHNII